MSRLENQRIYIIKENNIENSIIKHYRDTKTMKRYNRTKKEYSKEQRKEVRKV